MPLTADAYNVVLLTDSVPIVFPDVYWIAILAPPGEVGTLHFLDSNRFPLPGRAETSVAQGLTDLPSAWGAGVDSGDSTLLAEALT